MQTHRHMHERTKARTHTHTPTDAHTIEENQAANEDRLTTGRAQRRAHFHVRINIPRWVQGRRNWGKLT